MHNGLLKSSAGFDDSFLSEPSYVYEVFRVINSIPLFIGDHLERLSHTARLMQLELPVSLHDIELQVKELIRANRLENGNMKIVFLDGGSRSIPRKKTTGKADADVTAGFDFMIFVVAHQYPTLAQFSEGVPVVLFEGVRHNPNAKVMDVSLRSETNRVKQQEDAYETLLVDAEGCITEGSRSNVFFIIGDRVVTPPLSDVLPGITRKHIFECCRNKQIPLAEEKMPVSRLDEVDAVFISGTSRKVLPVNRIGHKAFNARHQLIRDILHAFNNHVTVYLLKAEL